MTRFQSVVLAILGFAITFVEPAAASSLTSDQQKNIDDLPKEVEGIINQLSLQPPAGAPVMRRTSARTMSS